MAYQGGGLTEVYCISEMNSFICVNVQYKCFTVIFFSLFWASMYFYFEINELCIFVLVYQSFHVGKSWLFQYLYTKLSSHWNALEVQFCDMIVLHIYKCISNDVIAVILKVIIIHIKGYCCCCYMYMIIYIPQSFPCGMFFSHSTTI